jgi:hypothetical protein
MCFSTPPGAWKYPQLLQHSSRGLEISTAASALRQGLEIITAASALLQGLGNIHSCFSTPPGPWKYPQLLQHSSRDWEIITASTYVQHFSRDLEIITAASALLQGLENHRSFYSTSPGTWKSLQLLQHSSRAEGITAVSRPLHRFGNHHNCYCKTF